MLNICFEFVFPLDLNLMGNCLNKSILQDTNTILQDTNVKLAEATYAIPAYSLVNLSMAGKVVNVYDGDTVHIVFQINSQLVKYNCRLLGIDSPEICPKNVTDKVKREQEIASAIKSRNYLITQVTGIETADNLTKKDIKELCARSRKLVWVKCYDFDKYGRLLVEIFLNANETVSINKQMVGKKLAVEYDGGTKKEFKPVETIELEV